VLVKAVKFVRFRHREVESYGVLLRDDKVLRLPLQNEASKPLDDTEFYHVERLKHVRKVLETFSEEELNKMTVNLSEVKLLAPLRAPPKVVCMGLNYKAHAKEQGSSFPKEPIIFMKPRTAITGPDSPIVKPNFVKQLDYEGELAIVIGEKCKKVSVTDAKNKIFGYTVFNDVSARDIQFGDKQWTRGKSFDTFAPIGPWVVSNDEIKDPQNLRIRTWVNGELRQDSSTRDMIFNVYEIVHHMSRVMTLEPGDLIATGTPAGVGVFMKPKPKFLKAGDVVEIEIESIGKLRNVVVEE